MSLKSQIRSDIADVFLNTSDFADTVLYRGAEVAAIKTEYGTRRPAGRDLLVESDVAARGVDFQMSFTDITADDEIAIPQAGDEIEWTDDDGHVHTFVVFPRYAEKCFDGMDDRNGLVRLYTFAENDFRPLVVTLANGREPFTVPAIPATIRAAEDYTDARSETRVLTTTAYVARSDLASVDTPPAAAKCDFLGLAGWAIDMNRTEWGQGLVKIGLMRETLVREWQARRNATV